MIIIEKNLNLNLHLQFIVDLYSRSLYLELD